MTTHDPTQPSPHRHLRRVPAPPATEPERARLSVRNETDLLALIPYTFGFHPHRSLVLMVLDDAGHPMFARVDLRADPAESDAARAELLHAAVVNGGRRAVLVAYSDDEAEAIVAVDRLAEELADRGVEVVAGLRADAGRWWPLLPGSPDGDGAGIPYDVSTHPITATGVVEGKVTHRNREQLAETLLPHDPDLLEAVAQAHTAWGPLPADRAGLRAEALWLEAWVARHVDPDVSPLTGTSAEELARAVRALAHLELRDVAWAAMSRATAEAHVRLWTSVVAQCPLDLLAPAAGLLAFAAWLSGHGALAWCAIDRCLSSDPDHGLARLVAQTLDAAMPPTVWQPLPRSSLRLLTG